MIDIQPFKALRPRKDLSGSIASQPYDVPTLEEVRKEIAKQPLSFLRVIRAEGDFSESIDPHLDKVYERSKFNFDYLRENKYLVQDDKDYFYIYKEKKGNYQQIGFIGAVSVDDYENGIIKKHEKTRIEKENDRKKHIESLNAQTGSVFLMYRSKSELNQILENIQKIEPDISFKSNDNIEHILWVIKDDKQIKNIRDGFKEIDYLYIADGHHRAAAASSVAKHRRNTSQQDSIGENSDDKKESEYFMGIIYPDDTLKILPYNRAVRHINIVSPENFLTKIKMNFIVGKAEVHNEDNGYDPETPRKIGMYFNDRWYSLEAKDNIIKTNDPVASLDVSLLQDNILKPLLGIDDPRIDGRIEFIDGLRGSRYLKDLVDSRGYTVAFSMYPPSIEELMAVADANKLMPPKSTWFDPKPRSGLTIHLLD